MSSASATKLGVLRRASRSRAVCKCKKTAPETIPTNDKVQL